MTAWIRMVSDDDASHELRQHFDQVRAPSGSLDNVMRVHSLRSHTMLGHYALYMSVLHHHDNTLPGWLSEAIASYTSWLNHCDYSVTNHWANAKHLIGDEQRAMRIHDALKHDRPEDAFDGAELAMMRYVKKLTLTPQALSAHDINAMRQEGVNDGEILEVNQVCGYFNYVNRLLNGLGVTLHGDVVGFYSDNTNE